MTRAQGRLLRIASRPELHRVPARDVRQHLLALQDAGLPERFVADRSGVSRSTIRKVRDETQRSVSIGVEEKLLGVKAHELPPDTLIDARETKVLLRELTDAGHSLASLARRLGLNTPAVQLGQDRVQLSTAQAVQRLAVELLPAPDERAPKPLAMRDPLAAFYATVGGGRVDRSWHDAAACAGVDYRTFDFTRAHTIEDQQRALTYCADCRVRHPCLEQALHGADPGGVMGGTTAIERRALRQGSVAHHDEFRFTPAPASSANETRRSVA